MSRLRQVRKASGLTQQEVATRVGIARTTYTHIERGREPSMQSARRLAALFDLSLDWLFPSPQATAPEEAVHV